MSHVVTCKFACKDIGALKAACPKLGLIFHEGQTEFDAFQHGLKCDHAISLRGKKGAYEIGVKKVDDEYRLLFDPYSGGNGMMAAVGENCGKLMMYYNKEVAMSEINSLAAVEGLSVVESVENGELVVKLM